MPPIALVLIALAGVALYAAFASTAEAASDPAGGAAARPGPFAAGASLLGALGVTGSSSSYQLPAAAGPYRETILEAEAREGLPAGLLGRLLYQESRYRPEIISGELKSSAGAIGIAQFMPATAAELGVDARDPFASIDAAALYLRRLYDRFGSWRLALAAYNWGQGNVARRGLEAAPAETRQYVDAIALDVGIA